MGGQTSVGSSNPLRVIAVVVGSLATAESLILLRAQLFVDSSLMGLSLLAASATVATVCWWFTFLGHRPLSRRRIACAAWGGVALGGLSLLGGFCAGPLLYPESNLAPLLGVFITGPLGFALGVVAGWLWGLVRVRTTLV